MKLRIIALFVAFMGVLSPLTASEFFSDMSVTIKDPVQGDVYAAANSVRNIIALGGDFTASGNSVSVDAPVKGDFNGAGANVAVIAPVADDVRIAGGSIILSGSVGGDAILAGGNISIPASSKVAGDLVVAGGTLQLSGDTSGKAYIAGGQVNMTGKIEGPVRITGGAVDINGVINGDAEIRAEDSLIINDGAKFYGKVRYWTPDGEVDFKDSVQSGQAVFDPALEFEYAKHDSDDGAAVGFFSFILVLSGIILSGVLVFLFPHFFNNTGEILVRNPVMAVGSGLLYYLLSPAVILVLFVILIGIPIALFLGALYGFSIAFSIAISSVVFAYALNSYLNKGWSEAIVFAVAAGFFISFTVVGIIPFVGFIVALIGSLAGMGAFVMGVIHTYRGQHHGAKPL